MKKQSFILIILIVTIVLTTSACGLFGGGGEENTREVLVYYSPGEYFVTNLFESESLVKVTVSLGMSEDQTEMLTNENALVRNDITFILRSLKEEDFNDPNLEKTLSDKICSKLNSEFQVDIFKRVIFSDLLVQ